MALGDGISDEVFRPGSYRCPGQNKPRRPMCTAPIRAMLSGVRSGFRGLPFRNVRKYGAHMGNGPKAREPGVAGLPGRPRRRSRAQGRWSVARAAVTGWTDCDRGPRHTRRNGPRSAHRAIEIREKRRGPLVASCLEFTLRCSPRGYAAGRSPCMPLASERAVWRGIDSHGHVSCALWRWPAEPAPPVVDTIEQFGRGNRLEVCAGHAQLHGGPV